MDRFDKRWGISNVALLAILGGVILTLSTAYVFIFRVMPGEDEAIINKMMKQERAIARATVISPQEYVALREASYEIKKEVQEQTESSMDYTMGPLTEISFHSSTPENVKELNSLSYSLAKDAVDKYWGHLPEQFRDPLVILAQASAESNWYIEGKIMWSPALPTALIPESEWTKDNLLSFNHAKLVKHTKGRQYRKINAGFVGPLQHDLYYGVAQMKDDALLTYKDEDSVVRSDTSALSNWNSMGLGGTHGLRKTTSHGDWGPRTKVGDRWNWHDATLITAAKWGDTYRRMKRDFPARETKLKSVTHSAFVAYIGLQHNVGESVGVLSDNYNSTTIYSGAKIKNVWNYLMWIGSAEVDAAIQKMAEEKVKKYRESGTPVNGHMSQAQMLSLIDNYGSGVVETSKVRPGIVTGSPAGKKFEVPAHALKIALHYKVLKLLYSGQ